MQRNCLLSFGHGFLVHSQSAVAAHVNEPDVNQRRNKKAKDKFYIGIPS